MRQRVLPHEHHPRFYGSELNFGPLSRTPRRRYGRRVTAYGRGFPSLRSPLDTGIEYATFIYLLTSLIGHLVGLVGPGLARLSRFGTTERKALIELERFRGKDRGAEEPTESDSQVVVLARRRQRRSDSRPNKPTRRPRRRLSGGSPRQVRH
jgi:hypothetical protein